MDQSTTHRASVAATLASPPIATGGNARAQTATPASSDIESVVGAYYEPFNTGDTSVYDTILAEDFADHPLAPGQQPGREGLKSIIGYLRGVFPDLEVKNEDIITADDKAAVRSTLRGTQRGEIIGIPATGKRAEIMTIDIHRVEGGQIAESWHIEDYLSLISQLGATIQPGLAEMATSTN
jgi:steroid delta-isomerase-like uncharacterized protein